MSLGHGASIVRDGLVLHLDAANPKSYPGSGTVWSDLSGNGNHGTLVNGVGYSGDNNGSMIFDGVDDYISLGNILSFGTDSFTISFYFEPNIVSGGGQYGLISKRGTGSLPGTAGWEIRQNGRNLRVVMSDGTNFIYLDMIIDVFNVGIWSEITVSFDREANVITPYLNSRDHNTTDISQIGDISGPRDLVIGSEPTLIYDYNGKISSAFIYNRALTPEEIAQNFEAMRGRYGI